MPRTITCVDVLIASPGDVAAERAILVECIEDWNAANSLARGAILLPRRWELDVFPEMGEPPQDIIDKQIVLDSDIVLAVFWHRIGTPTQKAASGTVQEITQFVQSKKPVSLYFSKAAVPSDHDQDQLRRVREYRIEMQKQGVAFDYPDVNEFRRMAMRHLNMKLNLLMPPLAQGSALVTSKAIDPSKSPLARLSIRKGRKGRSGDVPTVTIVCEMTNLSQVRLQKYACVLSVPAATLTFQSAHFPLEKESRDKGWRSFRSSEQTFSNAPIFPGDTLQLMTLELGVDQLKMAGTCLAGDYEGTMKSKIVAEAWADDQHYRQEMVIADAFSDS